MTRTDTRLMDTLDFIAAYIEENHYPPSIREIQHAVGYKTPSHVAYNLDKLEDQGFIKRGPKYSRRRALSLTIGLEYTDRVPLLGTFPDYYEGVQG